MNWLKFKRTTYRSRYHLLLISLIFVVFGDLMFPTHPDIYQTYTRPLWSLFSVLAGWNLVHKNKNKNYAYALILALLACGEIINLFRPIQSLSLLKQFGYMGFFIIFSLELFNQIRTARKVTNSTLTAVLCGLIIIGIAGGIGATLIEYFHPQSFQGAISEDPIINFQYFSFITLSTVGYGDITPITLYAKKFTILLTLTGNFYTIVIIGVIIGKYTSTKIIDEGKHKNKKVG